MISTLTDNQVIVGIMRATARLGDGHTGTWPEAVRGWNGLAALIQLYDFADGLYVTASDTGYPGLAGSRVVRIAGHSVERVRSAVDSLVGKDHVLGSRAAFTRFLRYPQVGLVLQRVARLAMVGIGVGLAGAVAATRWIESQLFGVSAVDPVTYAVGSISLLALAMLAMLASWLPARRAAHTDAVKALRSD